jgi:hypothetical protein
VIQTKIEEKMSRDWKPYPVFHLVTTAGCGSTHRLDRIQATTHWCVLMLEISPGRRSWMHAWGRELDTNMLATSSVHARERRLVGPFTPPHAGAGWSGSRCTRRRARRVGSTLCERIGTGAQARARHYAEARARVRKGEARAVLSKATRYVSFPSFEHM